MTVIFFVLAAVGAVFFGMIVQKISSLFLDGREAKIAAIAFLVGGFVLGSRSSNLGAVASLDATLGYLLGIAVVWWLLFKRETQDG
ncbi:MAG: hypothetical protein JNJ92_05700 [Altererythrobacter sp.]|nr:hypothetical protein [Altererythrobacter sp.]